MGQTNEIVNPKQVLKFLGKMGEQLPESLLQDKDLMQFGIENAWLLQDFLKNLEESIRINHLRLTAKQFFAFTSALVTKLAKPFREENLNYVKGRISEHSHNDYFGICYPVFNDKKATWELCLKALDSLGWTSQEIPMYEEIWNESISLPRGLQKGDVPYCAFQRSTNTSIEIIKDDIQKYINIVPVFSRTGVIFEITYLMETVDMKDLLKQGYAFTFELIGMYKLVKTKTEKKKPLFLNVKKNFEYNKIFYKII